MTRDSRHLPNGRDGEAGSGRSPSGAVPPQSGNRPTPPIGVVPMSPPPSLQDERAPSGILLPPVDGQLLSQDYLDGWVDGQTYLLANQSAAQPNAEVERLRNALRGLLNAQTSRERAYAAIEAHAALSEERTQVSDTPIPLPDELREMADNIVRDVAELPDRTSPDDWPDAMLVTSSELRDIVLTNLDTLTATKPSGQVEREAIVAWIREDAASWGGNDADLRDCLFKYADAIERGDHLAALSPQSQPAAQSESHTA